MKRNLRKILINGFLLGAILFFNIYSIFPTMAAEECVDAPGKTCLSVPLPVDCDIVPLSGELDSRCEKKEIGGLVDLVTTMYRFAVGAGIFLAIVMIIIGGLQYTASELPGVKDDGLGKIKNAIFGLILLALSIPILHFINPQITLLSDSEIITVSTSTQKYKIAYSCNTPEEECRPGIMFLNHDNNTVKQCTADCRWKDLNYHFFGIIPTDLSTWEFFHDDAVYKRAVGSPRINLCGTPKSQCNRPSSTLSSDLVIGSDGVKTETKHYCTAYCEDIIEYRRIEETPSVFGPDTLRGH